MQSNLAGVLLPAAVTSPAAFAAFAYVRDLPWSLRFTCFEPLELDIEYGDDFQACLDGGSDTAFDKVARAAIALHLMTVVSRFGERHLKFRGFTIETLVSSLSTRKKALENLRRAAVSQVQRDLNDHFDKRPETWASRLRAEVAALAHDASQEVTRYTGLDQEVGTRELRSGLNYVFSTLEPRIVLEGGQQRLAGNERKLREAKAARMSSDEKARARSLVVRAAVAVLDRQHADVCPSSAEEALDRLEETVRALVSDKGSWGLIDETIVLDREEGRIHLPDGLPPAILELVHDQEKRITLARGLVE